MANVSPQGNSIGGDVAASFSTAGGNGFDTSLQDHRAALVDLESRLRWRRRTTDLLDRYYHGRHRLAFATAKYEDAFGSLFGAWADNWCAVIADVPNERLKVEGFVAPGSKEVNEKAWSLWKDNDMPLYSATAHLGAIVTGHSYVLVDATGEATDDTTINVWPSSNAIVRRDPITRKPVSGMVTWVNDDGSVGAEVYLPSGAQRFRTKDKPAQRSRITGSPTPIVPAGVVGSGGFEAPGGIGSLVPDASFVTAIEQTEWLTDGPFTETGGEIPLVEFTNRPNEMGLGRSDVADVLSLQDAINKLANDMIVASEFQAFRQRVLTGVEVPKNPETGQPLPSQQLEAAMSRLWVFEPEGAKVHELNAADLGNWVTGIKELLLHLAAQTRTPPHYLLGQMVNISGDALAAAESGLVYRVEAKMTSFSCGWEEVLRLAGIEDAEVVWKNPERASFSIRADAVTKLSADNLGLPIETLWRLLGFSPLEIEEMKKDNPRYERALEVGATQVTERLNANATVADVTGTAAGAATDTTPAAGVPAPAAPAPRAPAPPK